MENRKKEDLLASMTLRQAICRLVLPTIAGQVILVIYNVADTFFMGMTGDEAKVTALTVCMPAFMVLSAIANLFGTGGAGAVSRALGTGDRGRAGQSAALSFWGCAGMTVLYSLLSLALLDPLTDFLGGGSPLVHGEAARYLLVTVVLGGAGTTLGTFFSHMLRAEGHGVSASIGIALGGGLNILLDPLFMFVLFPKGEEILGAAAATALSNLISFLFFTVVLLRNRRNTALSFFIRRGENRQGLPREILSAGLPACMMTLCENLSLAVLGKTLSRYGVMVQAGVGTAKRINMLAHSITRGAAQGMMPVIAYDFASGNRRRLRRAAVFTTAFSTACAIVCMTVCLAFSPQLNSLFLDGGTKALYYGTHFLRILCLGGPFSACAYTCISFFQSTKRGGRALTLALLRKGVLDIPLMLVLDAKLPVFGAVWATPITDVLCSLAAGFMVLRLRKKS